MPDDLAQILDRVESGFRRMHERIDEGNEANAKLSREVGQILAGCKSCQMLVAKHEIDLRGNNGDGIKTRVALLEKTQEEIVDPAQRAKVAQRNAIGSFIAGAISAIAAAAAAIFR